MTRAERVAAERRAQGLPVHVEDPVALAQVAALLANPKTDTTDQTLHVQFSAGGGPRGVSDLGGRARAA